MKPACSNPIGPVDKAFEVTMPDLNDGFHVHVTLFFLKKNKVNISIIGRVSIKCLFLIRSTYFS